MQRLSDGEKGTFITGSTFLIDGGASCLLHNNIKHFQSVKLKFFSFCKWN
ncbi:hypothetical protein BRYFOR_05994 [Marvinbryantia formatexigens DSM 14469]|uniref:Uncharacterized protein n=1 Tax=Marvinbryantia formatexigens DSM 14469 TaxID=478749 RepID=C6LBJ9_9FIRM|nr:hypothetical protein BRYFOR_05994 [Marvinbryantia formatexigens DSM 14469]